MITKAFWVGLLLALPFAAGALGLGGISVHSFLDQPLNAQIKLISADQVAVDDIQVSLAEQAAFEKVGLERPFLLSQLRFTPAVDADGRIVIKVATRQAVREPFLNFLVQVSWAGSRLLKEYTVLLDPPGYQPPLAVELEPPVKSVSGTGAQPPQQDRSMSYGPIRSSETLWVIAQKTRPDRSFSVEQMMMALLRLNPAAFRRGNVNLLKQGVVLEIPDREFIAALSTGEARAQFLQQTRDWRSMGKRSTDGPGPADAARQEPPEASAPLQPTPVPAEPGRTLKDVESGGEEVSQQLSDDQRGDQLSVIEPAEHWNLGDQPESTYSYPSDDKDKLREAIADSKQDALAVREINQDLEKLQSVLELQIQALRQSLEEKNKEISRLKQRVAVTEVQLESSESGRGVETTRIADSKSAPEGAATRVPEVARIESIPPFAAPQPAGPSKQQLVLNWVQNNWIPLLVVAGVLLLLMAWKRRKQPSAASHQSVNSFRSYTELDQSPPAGVTAGQLPGSFRSYTDEQGLFPEVGEDAASILTKADIYLAYRQYDQAASLVRESIRANPSNWMLKAKLLEIYAFRKDKNGFVQYLEEVHDSMPQAEPEIWTKVIAMGRDLVPDHPLISASQLPGESGPDSSVDELLALESAFASSVVTPDEGLHEDSLPLLELEPDLNSQSSRS